LFEIVEGIKTNFNMLIETKNLFDPIIEFNLSFSFFLWTPQS